MRKTRKLEQITAVILAAGLGTRMRTDLPKVLHGLGSETLLGKVVSSLKQAGIDEMITVVGHKAEIIERLFNDRVRFVRQPELLGSGDAVGHAVDYLKDASGLVLVTCGDTPLVRPASYRKLVKAHVRSGADCTLLTAATNEPMSYGRIVRGADGNVARIVEQKDATPEERMIREINVGTYCFDQRALKRHIRDVKLNKRKKEYYLTDIIALFTDRGKTVRSVKCEEREAIGINSRRDLAKAYKALVQAKSEALMEKGVTIMAPENTYIDELSDVGRDTVIFPGCVIEGDVKIGRNCRIGPYAHLREGTRLADNVVIGNFVEVCRTRVGTGSMIKHQCYLGDARIGKGVNIGAGTITANFDGTGKNVTVIGDGAFIGVGTCLVAPVKVERNAVTGAGSVLPKGRKVAAGTVVAGVPARLMRDKKGAGT